MRLSRTNMPLASSDSVISQLTYAVFLDNLAPHLRAENPDHKLFCHSQPQNPPQLSKSGKGRVLLLASHYPFRSIIGVEISLILCQIATDNIETYLTHRRRQCDISVVRRGIDEFDYPELGTANHLLIYMYNPCSESVLMTAVEKLSGSAAQGVLVTIIYLN